MAGLCEAQPPGWRVVLGVRGTGWAPAPPSVTLDQSLKSPLGLLRKVGLIKRGRVGRSWLTGVVTPAFAVREGMA